jgi:hypothetical protein
MRRSVIRFDDTCSVRVYDPEDAPSVVGYSQEYHHPLPMYDKVSKYRRRMEPMPFRFVEGGAATVGGFSG